MNVLQPLCLPPYPFKIIDDGKTLLIFDDIRKKMVILTPEEWVRQHFVRFLIHQKKYPKSLIKLEGGLKLHGMPMRSDITVFNHSGEKILLVECKAPSIDIDQKVFDQIARYNMAYKVPLLAVSNGLKHYCCEIDFLNSRYIFLDNLPEYKNGQQR